MFQRLFAKKENNQSCCDVQIVEVNDETNDGREEPCCEDDGCEDCC
jgi:hypothetical protein